MTSSRDQAETPSDRTLVQANYLNPHLTVCQGGDLPGDPHVWV